MCLFQHNLRQLVIFKTLNFIDQILNGLSRSFDCSLGYLSALLNFLRQHLVIRNITREIFPITFGIAGLKLIVIRVS